MMQLTRVALCSLVVFAFWGSVGGTSHCSGGSSNNKCGSWFSHFECPGTCCHDDFNTWCCPEGPWECHGVFHGPHHCENTKSCRCTDTTYYIVKVEAEAEPTTKYMPAWNLNECCIPTSSLTCGWGPGTSIAWTQTQQVSWSNTFSSSLTVEAHGTLDVVGLSTKITLSDSYTNGQEKTETVKQSISTPCQGTFQDTKHLSFTAQVALYEVPVKITYSHCGAQSTTSGTVKSSAFVGEYECTATACNAPNTTCDVVNGCTAPNRRLHDIVV